LEKSLEGYFNNGILGQVYSILGSEQVNLGNKFNVQSVHVCFPPAMGSYLMAEADGMLLMEDRPRFPKRDFSHRRDSLPHNAWPQSSRLSSLALFATSGLE